MALVKPQIWFKMISQMINRSITC